MAGVTLSFWAQVAASTPGQKGGKSRVRSQSQEQLLQMWDQRFRTDLGGFAPAFPAGPEGSLVMKINLCLFSVPGDLGEGQQPPLGTHKSKSF